MKQSLERIEVSFLSRVFQGGVFEEVLLYNERYIETVIALPTQSDLDFEVLLDTVANSEQGFLQVV